MKKVSKSSKKGFTLVELIVVLVILAILAAMLVPALTGYIKRAREEKDFQAAATLQTAAQAVITEIYGTYTGSTAFASNDLKASNSTYGSKVFDLAGIEQGTTSGVTDFSFHYDADGIITWGWVKINGSYYNLTNANSNPNWAASSSATTGNGAATT